MSEEKAKQLGLTPKAYLRPRRVRRRHAPRIRVARVTSPRDRRLL